MHFVLGLFLILAPNWRLFGVHDSESRDTDTRSRQNLRLEPDVWKAIDAAREKRSGYIPRNTWITEAILEKLEREKARGTSGASGV